MSKEAALHLDLVGAYISKRGPTNPHKMSVQSFSFTPPCLGGRPVRPCRHTREAATADEDGENWIVQVSYPGGH